MMSWRAGRVGRTNSASWGTQPTRMVQLGLQPAACLADKFFSACQLGDGRNCTAARQLRTAPSHHTTHPPGAECAQLSTSQTDSRSLAAQPCAGVCSANSQRAGLRGSVSVRRRPLALLSSYLVAHTRSLIPLHCDTKHRIGTHTQTAHLEALLRCVLRPPAPCCSAHTLGPHTQRSPALWLQPPAPRCSQRSRSPQRRRYGEPVTLRHASATGS